MILHFVSKLLVYLFIRTLREKRDGELRVAGGEETDSSEFVWWGVISRNPYLVFQPKHVIFSVMHSRFCILELSRLFAPSSLPFSVKSFRAGATLKLPGIARTRAQGGLGGGGMQSDHCIP